MVYQRAHKSSSWQPPSRADSVRLAPRPAAGPGQQDLQPLASAAGGESEVVADASMQRSKKAAQSGHRFADILVRTTDQQTSAQAQPANAPGENRTGMPLPLKAGLEQLSGLDLSAVRVHYNSDKPAQLNALAYTKGHEIEVGPGQERHLPHEAWHVVQQAQGRVKPTMQMKDGVPVNDDAGLEREADAMGNVLQSPSPKRWTGSRPTRAANLNQTARTVQRMEYEEALMMLKEGIASLAAHRRIPNSSIDAYMSVRHFGPPEGLTTLDGYKLSELGAALMLTVTEEMALYAYSQPDKDKPETAFYMGQHSRWKPYGNGWEALNAAVAKLPKLRDLNLTGGQVPTFRAEREDSLFMKRLADRSPCYILHGQRSIGDTRTRHFVSASVMGSSVHMTDNRAKGGSLRFECPSARFIQTFGGMSTAVDGGEVLIPPGTITYCDGKPHMGQFGPEYTLEEVGFETVKAQSLLKRHIPLIEDKDGKDITAQFSHLYVGGM